MCTEVVNLLVGFICFIILYINGLTRDILPVINIAYCIPGLTENELYCAVLRTRLLLA